MDTPVNTLLDPDDFPAYSVIRGHTAVFDPNTGWWRWADTGEPMGDPEWDSAPWTDSGATLRVGNYPIRFPDPYPPPRGCAECGRFPTSNGHDACIADLPGIVAACCGHGGRQPAYRRTAEDVERIRRQLEAEGLLDE